MKTFEQIQKQIVKQEIERKKMKVGTYLDYLRGWTDALKWVISK